VLGELCKTVSPIQMPLGRLGQSRVDPRNIVLNVAQIPPHEKQQFMKVLPVNKFRCFVQKAALARRDVAEISTTIIKLAASIAKSVKRRSGVCLSASLPVIRSVR